MNFKRAFLTLMVLMLLPGLATAQFTARFDVNKIWLDHDLSPGINDATVDVEIVCNSGLPLTQEATISATEGVIFVVEELLDISAINCTISEKSVPVGYKEWSVSNAGPLTEGGCLFVGGDGGNAFELNECDIINQALPTTFTVTTDWTVINDGGDAVNQVAGITIVCNAEIEGGVLDLDSGDWVYQDTLVGDDFVTVLVDTAIDGTECRAWDDVVDSAVDKSGSTCIGDFPLGPNSPNSCGFVYTVFFEGIPTLSQYGLAIMALLMLGVGFVGFRRFV